MKNPSIRRLSKGDWHGTLLPPTATIQDAIRILNKVSLRIVLVVNSQGKLEGTISDGDIRRAMLRGYDFKTLLVKVLHRNPLVVSPAHETGAVFKLMLANEIQQIPIVDSQRRVVGLHLWDKISQNSVRDNWIVVMAGGEGRRLLPYTLNRPKPLVEVAGKPLLEHILLKAKEEGFSKFAIAVHHLGKMIENYFGTGKKWGIKIVYLRERTRLGTAGAIRLLKPPPDKPFIVTNGDVLADFRYGELLDFHISHGAGATMAVRAHEWENPYGVVETQGLEIVRILEKPKVRSQINAGVYVLSPAVPKLVPPGANCDMPSLFALVKNKGLSTVAYPLHEYWLDVGEPNVLRQASQRLGKK